MGPARFLAAFVAAVICLVVAMGCAPGSSPAASPTGPAAAQVDLVGLSAVDSSHVWAAARECAGNQAQATACRTRVYRSSDGGATWAQTARFLLSPRSIAFVDPSTGWMVGAIGESCGSATCPNAVMLSTDAGARWDRVSTVSAELIDVATTSPLDAWALGELCSNESGCSPLLFRSTSGGQSWDSRLVPVDGRDFRLQRLDATTGLVGGMSDTEAVLARTRDRGATWQTSRTSCQGSDARFTFRTAEEGWLACVAPPGASRDSLDLYHTADAGQSWTRLTRLTTASASPPTPDQAEAPPLPSFSFSSPTDGLLATGGGELFRTDDGGRTWQRLVQADEPLLQIEFTDARHGWLLGQQSIWRTVDGGKTWQKSSVAVQ